jgi:sec-independent protein translocase protein TatA
MISPGPVEISIIAGILLLLFGTRIPKIARGLGQSITEFKKGLKENKQIAKN